MALTVPLWRVVCCLPWFGALAPRGAQAFRNAYVRALSKARVLHIVQNAHHEARRRFTGVAGWEGADTMQGWLDARAAGCVQGEACACIRIYVLLILVIFNSNPFRNCPPALYK